MTPKSRETAVFKGHGHSTTHTDLCKVCTPHPLLWQMLLPRHTPSLDFCRPKKTPSSPQAICQGWPSCCHHQGGLTWKSAKWHFGNTSLLSLLRDGTSMWWATERLPQAAPNIETPGLTWHSLSSILNSSVLFSALEFQSRPGTAKLRTHSKVYKRFSQWHLIFFPQVTEPTCGQQLS